MILRTAIGCAGANAGRSSIAAVCLAITLAFAPPTDLSAAGGKYTPESPEVEAAVQDSLTVVLEALRTSSASLDQAKRHVGA